MSDPLKPTATLLLKIGSIVVHVDEMLSQDGHPVDRLAIQTLLDDAEVNEWLSVMDKLALLPKKRTQ